MKKYSAKWNSSTSKRKQRKFRFQAPLHTRHKLMSAQLSEELRKKHGMKSIAVRKEDEVKVMRGKFQGKSGKIKTVDTKKIRVTIDKLQNQKKDGTKIEVYFHPSNLQITQLNATDKMRMKTKAKTEEAKKENKTENKKEETKGDKK